MTSVVSSSLSSLSITGSPISPGRADVSSSLQKNKNIRHETPVRDIIDTSIESSEETSLTISSQDSSFANVDDFNKLSARLEEAEETEDDSDSFENEITTILEEFSPDKSITINEDDIQSTMSNHGDIQEEKKVNSSNIEELLKLDHEFIKTIKELNNDEFIIEDLEITSDDVVPLSEYEELLTNRDEISLELAMATDSNTRIYNAYYKLALKYRDLKLQLKEQRKSNANKDDLIGELKDELKAFNNQIILEKNKVEELKIDNSNNQEIIYSLRNEVSFKNKTIENLQRNERNLSQLQTENETFAKNLQNMEILEQSLKTSHETIYSQKEIINELQEDKDLANKQMASLENENKELQSLIKHLQLKLSQEQQASSMLIQKHVEKEKLFQEKEKKFMEDINKLRFNQQQHSRTISEDLKTNYRFGHKNNNSISSSSRSSSLMSNNNMSSLMSNNIISNDNRLSGLMKNSESLISNMFEQDDESSNTNVDEKYINDNNNNNNISNNDSNGEVIDQSSSYNSTGDFPSNTSGDIIRQNQNPFYTSKPSSLKAIAETNKEVSPNIDNTNIMMLQPVNQVNDTFENENYYHQQQPQIPQPKIYTNNRIHGSHSFYSISKSNSTPYISKSASFNQSNYQPQNINHSISKTPPPNSMNSSIPIRENYQSRYEFESDDDGQLTNNSSDETDGSPRWISKPKIDVKPKHNYQTNHRRSRSLMTNSSSYYNKKSQQALKKSGSVIANMKFGSINELDYFDQRNLNNMISSERFI